MFINNFKFKNEMLNLFAQGEKKEFFRRWLENVSPHQVTEDLEVQKLELELNLHFAIYPLRLGGKEVNKSAPYLFLNSM